VQMNVRIDLLDLREVAVLIGRLFCMCERAGKQARY
jgi:hypothetical protein